MIDTPLVGDFLWFRFLSPLVYRGDLPRCTYPFTFSDTKDRFSHQLNHDSISVVSSRIPKEHAANISYICLKTTPKHKTRAPAVFNFLVPLHECGELIRVGSTRNSTLSNKSCSSHARDYLFKI